jgi:hypothetical protein
MHDRIYTHLHCISFISSNRRERDGQKQGTVWDGRVSELYIHRMGVIRPEAAKLRV